MLVHLGRVIILDLETALNQSCFQVLKHLLSAHLRCQLRKYRLRRLAFGLLSHGISPALVSSASMARRTSWNLNHAGSIGGLDLLMILRV